MITLNDSQRRGLRTAIDVLLSAASSGLILVIYNVFVEPDMSTAAFATLFGTLTPVLSVIKNALEDKAGSSLLVSKQRPEPDPTAPDTPPSVLVAPSEEDVFADADIDLAEPPASVRRSAPAASGHVFGEVPLGWLLLAVAPEDVDEADQVVGVVR